ncbi:hypothetical protein ACFY3U_07660 [Micromonospora sp. NPDC000089]|uniref:hypothetical protein n=1 Tax=unclassified Micromonospora TaxID=2617518 RepID=UPI0036B2664E
MVDSQHTPARIRPAVVTTSSYLLILYALLQVISLIVSLSTIGTVRRVLNDAYSGSSASGAQNIADVAVAFTVGAGILTLLLAVGLIVLALINNRGKNGSRITTWVLGGILLCCNGGGLISNATGGFTGGTGSTSGDMPSGEEVQRRLSDALPGWFTPVTTLLGLLSLLVLLTALILLALPKANEFFRKPQPAWEPPVPGAAYPGQSQPGYPHPGQPQTGYPQAGYPPAGPADQPAPSAPDAPSATPSTGTPDAPTGGAPHAPHHPQATGAPDASPPGGHDGPPSTGGSDSSPGGSSTGGSDGSSGGSSGGGSSD